MKYSKIGLTLYILQFTFILNLFATDNFPKIGCSQCHKKEFNEFITGIHKRALITCADCHGGDINSTDGMAHATDNFVGKPNRRQIPEFCGKCHSNKQKMRAYGLSADQVELYYTSQHGRSLKKGNISVATCVDCHDKGHKIVAVKDTSSPVYAKNVANTCGRCHSDKTLMDSVKLSYTTIGDYMESIHAKALYEKGITNAPQCVSCHSSHGATPPGLKEITFVCGQCHVKEQQYLYESKHYKSFIKTKFKECVFCHSNHKILRPTTEKFDTVCIKCHKDKSRQYLLGQEIKNLIDTTSNLLSSGETYIDKAKKKGLYTSEVEQKISVIKTSLMEVQPVTHSLNIQTIKHNLTDVQNLCKEIINDVTIMFKSIVLRRWFLVFFWIFIIIVCVVAYVLRKSFMDEL